MLKTPHLIPSFETVQKRVGDFIRGDNASRDHAIDDLSDTETGERLSADEAMARWCDTRRVPADPDALNLLLMHWHRPVKANKNGITLTLAGRALHYGMFEPALVRFKALAVKDRPDLNVSYDPHDLAAVRVFDASWKYVCTLTMNLTGGAAGMGKIGVKHVAEVSRQKAIYDRSMRHVAEHSITQLLTAEEQAAENAAAEREAARRPAAPAAALQIVQTPLDGQAAEVERGELRQAAGSDSAPIPTGRRGLASLDRLRDRVQPRRRDGGDDDAGRRIDVMAKLREQNHEW